MANHRSIRDEQTLSFVASRRRGEDRQRTTGTPPTVPVAGIYGANASGKSNVLDALRWMQWAIQASHANWAPSRGVPRRPFLLTEEARAAPSFYELDFLHEGTRYSYGFEVDDEVVQNEWLFSFPHGRPRRLFERTGPGEDGYDFGRALTGEMRRIATLTRGNALYLSSAASNNHPLLGVLHHKLTTSIQFASQDFHGEHIRLLVTRQLLQNPATAPDINALLRLADLGIEKAEVVESEIPPELAERLERLHRLMAGDESLRVIPSNVDYLKSRIQLRRTGSDIALSIDEESAGTRVWLSIVGPTLEALADGSVLVVDEIDSSLHPLLSSTLLRMFKDPDINRRGAQLLFASHDTTLLGTMLSEELLSRDEVWFTQKDADGATTLFPLAEFHPRRDENVERGYLQGRYGAVPYLDFEMVRKIFQERQAALDEETA
ncbi:ATP-binding protein [Streptosporangium sp. NBC_01756]|nr:ATP-binding protein [Streptosporangium sp. NBC_01756]WSC90526.1 ATP-binding protein [Streptosporangium sp. NBC_01756]